MRMGACGTRAMSHWGSAPTPLLCAQGGDEDGFDGVEAVFGLVEDDAGGGVEDVAGDFEATGHAGVFHDFAADGGVGVVEGGQAVHEFDRRVAAGFHQGGVDLVGGEHSDPVGPDVFGFAHRHPHVGVDEVGAVHGAGGVVGDGDPRAGAVGDVGGQVGDVLGRVQLLGAGEPHVAAHQRAHDQQGAAHVEPAVPDERVADPVV